MITPPLGRVLVIDDQPDILDIVTVYLQESGYEVETAPDGTQGLAVVARHRPDVVLLDIRMPGLSGLEVLQQIRLRWPGLPVIMLTAVLEIEVARATLRRGAFDYIPKPFDFDHLHRCVAAALILHGGPDMAPKPPGARQRPGKSRDAPRLEAGVSPAATGTRSRSR